MMSNHIAMLLVRAMAVQAQIESMKAANLASYVNGRLPMYGEDHFTGAQKDLEAISLNMEQSQ